MSEPRRLLHEVEFQGREWGMLDDALVPSPEEIAARCLLIQGDWEEERSLADEEVFSGALIWQALKDIEDFDRVITEDEPGETVSLNVRTRRAVNALGWLLSDEDSCPHTLSFSDACEASGVDEVEAMRTQVLQKVRLSLQSARILLACA